MSHHKICPFCGKETRCPWEGRNVEEPCYECEPTFAAGYEAAIRDAWRIVLRQRAAEIERGLMAIDDEDAIERDAAEAAQLRAWAGEP